MPPTSKGARQRSAPSPPASSSSIWASSFKSTGAVLLLAVVPVLVAMLLASPRSHHAHSSEKTEIAPWPCTIPRIPLSELTPQPFRKAYKPFIVVLDGDAAHQNSTASPTPYNDAFVAQVTLASLVSDWGHLPAQLHGYQDDEEVAAKKRKTFTLADYLTEKMTEKPWTVGRSTNDTRYLFGNQMGEGWQDFFASYVRPPCVTCGPDSGADLKFGVGVKHSGVPWHFHGPGFSEVLIGRKRWFLYPPSTYPPEFHKDISLTTYTWMEEVLPVLQKEHDEQPPESGGGKTKPRPLPLTCDIGPGELLYFPSMYWHGIVNMAPYNAFVSTFLTKE